jgi:hypothetical protein
MDAPASLTSTSTSAAAGTAGGQLTFTEKLEKRILAVNSLLCVAIDPACIACRLFAYCANIIEKTADHVAAFKLNFAYFLQFSAQGISVLREVIELIPQDIPIILDAKFGDTKKACEVRTLHFLKKYLTFVAVCSDMPNSRSSGLTLTL